jgi:murein DD-endopeptidase MepM/ murein hydrolase activator NlpD
MRLFIGFLSVVTLFVWVFANAQTAGDLTQKINQKNADIARLEKEIADYQVQLANTSNQKDSLSKSIQELDLTRKNLLAKINLTNSKIEEKNLELEQLGTEISGKAESIDNNKIVLGKMIRDLNEKTSIPLFALVASQENIGDIWREAGTISVFNSQLSLTTRNLGDIKISLEKTEDQTKQLKSELVTLQNDLTDQKKIVDQNTAQKNKLLKDTKNQEANYQKILKQKNAEKEQFEQDVRAYETELKFILDPSKIPADGSGVLSWPLDSVKISQFFGKTVAAKRLYASGTHNGVDFGVPIGSPVKAMANGVVLGTGDTDVQCPGVSFGRFVTIKYDNGLSSTFGHLSVIKVSSGDSVVRGQIVGLSGNTGYSTGPHLHVSVYANGSVEVKTLPSKSCPGKVLTQPIAAINGYLDPMLYLPNYKK